MSNSNDTTYFIYRIVCFATGKCYVGQTNDHKRRTNEHFQTLRNGTHHSKRLQYAYNKYGRNAFYIEPLEENVPSSQSTEREKYWIEYYNSFVDGYNCHEGGNLGGSGSKSCIWNGVEYPSIAAAARAIGINNTSMAERVAKGYLCDSDMPGVKRKYTWNGIEYPSIEHAALAINVSLDVMYYRAKVGYKCDDDVKQRETPCKWNNMQYSSITEAALANGISKELMWYRMKKGYTCDADLKVRHK